MSAAIVALSRLMVSRRAAQISPMITSAEKIMMRGAEFTGNILIFVRSAPIAPCADYDNDEAEFA